MYDWKGASVLKIGKMDQYDGIFYDEIREFGLPTCKLAGDPELSDAIMEGAFDRGVDFAYSNELTIDHSIIVPMLFVRPEMDIPIVPILTNCIAPPMPRPRRLPAPSACSSRASVC